MPCRSRHGRTPPRGISSGSRARVGLVSRLAGGPALALVLTAVMPAQGPRPLVLTGARVLDVVAGRYLEGATVVLEGDRISQVLLRAAPPLPPAHDTLDLQGVTLVPGLGDMHASLAPFAEVDVDYHAALSLAHGVTMARNVDVRLPWAVAERERVRRGDVLAPRIWTSGPALVERAAGSLTAREVFDAEAAQREVQAQAAAGVDWIAVGADTRGEVYRAIIAAARAARRRVSGEASATSMAHLARLGITAIEHLGCPTRTRDEYGQLLAPRPTGASGRPLSELIWARLPEGDARAAILQLVRARTVLVPALAGALEDLQPDDVLKDPALSYLPSAARERLSAAVQETTSAGARKAAWLARARFVRDLVKAGGTVVTGTDYTGSGFGVPGAGVLKELTLLVRAGLTPAVAIRAATVNAAKMLGASQSVGQIEPGYAADLVGVEGDPLKQVEDLGRIKLIVRGGEVLERQQLLRQAERAIRR